MIASLVLLSICFILCPQHFPLQRYFHIILLLSSNICSYFHHLPLLPDRWVRDCECKDKARAACPPKPQVMASSCLFLAKWKCTGLGCLSFPLSSSYMDCCETHFKRLLLCQTWLKLTTRFKGTWGKSWQTYGLCVSACSSELLNY